MTDLELEISTPDGWPDWRFEQEVHQLTDGAYVGPEPFDPVKRAVHVPTGSILEKRWQDGRDRSTWTSSLPDAEQVDIFLIAQRVIAGKLPPRAGRKAGSGAITGARAFAAIVVFRRRYGRLPKRPADLSDPRYGELIQTKNSDARQLERAVARSWNALLDTADQFVAAELDLMGKPRPPT